MPIDETLRALLRDHGLKATRSRLAVLRVLSRADAPASHPEVTAALSADGWDRSTLYRNLVDMAEAGILRRIDLGDRVWRFELTGDAPAHDASEHPHFLCTVCGDLSCLESVHLHIGGAVPGSVSTGDVVVQLRGVCDTCA